MKKSIICFYVGTLVFNLFLVIPALSQFQQGTLIDIGAKGIEKDYDFKDQLHLGDLTVDYKQVGKYNIDEGSKVFIAYNGGLMQNFEFTLGKVTINEKILIGDSVIHRIITYIDGIPTMKVSPTKYKVKQGIDVDLNNLWLDLRQEKTIPVLTNQMNSKDPDIRLDAVKVLATCGKSASTPLLQALNDSNFVILISAIVANGKLKDIRAIKPLISLLNDESWPIRWKAAWALGQIKGTEQIVPLNQALKKEKDDFVRDALNKSLKKLGAIK